MNLWPMTRTPKFQGNDSVAIGVGVSRRKRSREGREEKDGGHLPRIKLFLVQHGNEILHHSTSMIILP